MSNTGTMAGFPLIDWKVTLTDGQTHDVDSSVGAFEIAARACFREAIPQCGPQLLEPMMKVEVTTPEDYMGDIIGDLSSRRGMVQGSEALPSYTIINAMVPLANMFGYINTLRSLSSGRAQFSMQFDHYEPVPKVPVKRGSGGLRRTAGQYRPATRLEPVTPIFCVSAAGPPFLPLEVVSRGERQRLKMRSKWLKKSLSVISRTSTSAPLATLTTARQP